MYSRQGCISISVTLCSPHGHIFELADQQNARTFAEQKKKKKTLRMDLFDVFLISVSISNWHAKSEVCNFIVFAAHEQFGRLFLMEVFQ